MDGSGMCKKRCGHLQLEQTGEANGKDLYWIIDQSIELEELYCMIEFQPEYSCCQCCLIKIMNVRKRAPSACLQAFNLEWVSAELMRLWELGLIIIFVDLYRCLCQAGERLEGVNCTLLMVFWNCGIIPKGQSYCSSLPSHSPRHPKLAHGLTSRAHHALKRTS